MPICFFNFNIRRVFILLYIPVTVLMYVVIGLDHRFGWSSMPVWLNLAGVVLFILACALRQELPGYQQYAATTKARLLPRVW